MTQSPQSPLSINCNSQPKLCRGGIIPPETLQELLLNLYTNAFFEAATTAKCAQSVLTSQITSINCDTPELIEATMAARMSPECIHALTVGLPNPEVYCTACSMTDISQDMILEINMNCASINDVGRIAGASIKDWLDNNLIAVVDPGAVLPLNKTGIVVNAVNEVVTQMSGGELTMQILQQLNERQQIYITGEEGGQNHISGVHKTAITELTINAINSNVAVSDAFQNMKKVLDEARAGAGASDDPLDESAADSTAWTQMLKWIIPTILILVLVILLGIMKWRLQSSARSSHDSRGLAINAI